MNRPTIIAAITLIMLTGSLTMQGASRGWEAVKTERTDARQVVKDTEIELKAAPNTIIVSSNHNVQIKIFTILGRLVSSETVSAGTSQLILPAHGVYIVKIGELTCKVAV